MRHPWCLVQSFAHGVEAPLGRAVIIELFSFTALYRSNPGLRALTSVRKIWRPHDLSHPSQNFPWLIHSSLVTIKGLPPKDPDDDDDENEEDEEDDGEEEEPAVIREPDE